MTWEEARDRINDYALEYRKLNNVSNKNIAYLKIMEMRDQSPLVKFTSSTVYVYQKKDESPKDCDPFIFYDQFDKKLNDFVKLSPEDSELWDNFWVYLTRELTYRRKDRPIDNDARYRDKQAEGTTRDHLSKIKRLKEFCLDAEIQPGEEGKYLRRMYDNRFDDLADIADVRDKKLLMYLIGQVNAKIPMSLDAPFGSEDSDDSGSLVEIITYEDILSTTDAAIKSYIDNLKTKARILEFCRTCRSNSISIGRENCCLKRLSVAQLSKVIGFEERVVRDAFNRLKNGQLARITGIEEETVQNILTLIKEFNLQSIDTNISIDQEPILNEIVDGFANSYSEYRMYVKMTETATQRAKTGMNNNKIRLIYTLLAVEQLIATKEYFRLEKIGFKDYYFITNYESTRNKMADYTYNSDLKLIKQLPFGTNKNERLYDLEIHHVYDWCDALSLFVPAISCELFAMGEIPGEREVRGISKKHGINVGTRQVKDEVTKAYVANVFEAAKRMYLKKISWAKEEALA